MRNLYDNYSDIITDDPKKWSYYLENSRVLENLWNRDQSAFISEYFSIGNKYGLLRDLFCKENDSEVKFERSEHTVSTFLLGILFYEKHRGIKTAINNMMEDIENRAKHSDPAYHIETAQQCFLYLWFMTCLFHDLGYKYEKQGIPFARTNDIESQYFPKVEIPSPDMGYIPEQLSKNAKIYSSKGLRRNGFRSRPCIDHGIAGGCILFKRMEELTNKNSANGSYAKQKDCYWGNCLLDNHILIAAWTIICHNIWCHRKNSPEADKYMRLGLEELLYDGEGERFIDMQKHPLLFLLCMVDTIEPVKNLKNFEELKKIRIDITERNVTIFKYADTRPMDFLFNNNDPDKFIYNF